MPPRPAIKSRDRPISAIYIGSPAPPTPASAPNNGHASSALSPAGPLPDLPEPPSPVSSVGSGLPSPPATNSTGSGSTGDPASIAVRRPHASMTVQNIQIQTGSSDSSDTRSSSRLSWKAGDTEFDQNLDQDEDQTMRLKIAGGSSNEQILQRARNLAQRNKIQLDKLVSGKLGRASPSSNSSKRNYRHSMPDPSQVLSGSETEREGDSAVFNSTSTTSSGSKSISNRVRLSSAPTSPHRARVQTDTNSNTSNATSPTRRRKRVSLANISTSSFNVPSEDENDNYDERLRNDRERCEVGTAKDRIRDRQDALREDRPSPRVATVNLNSFRKTPLGGTRRRSALPREFRDGSADEATTDEPPQTPYRAATASPLPATNAPSTSTMHSSTLGRRSTLRSTRGFSDDYRSSYVSRDIPSRTRMTPIVADNDSSTASSSIRTPNPATPITPASAKNTGTIDNHDYSPTIQARSNTMGRHTAARRERGQTLRGGSAESALGGLGGRSLVGEGLRAAGLSRRPGPGTFREREREKERAANTTLSETQEQDRELDKASVVSGSSSRSRPKKSILDTSSLVSPSPDLFKGEERKVDWSPESTESVTRRQQRGFDPSGFGSRALPPRASTSMADYSYTSRARRSRTSIQHFDSEDDQGQDDDDDDDDKKRKELRAYKSAYGVLSSRDASLARREQTLREKERELGRRERELDRERAVSVLGRHHTGSTTNVATPAPTPTLSSTRERDRDHYSGTFGSARRTPGTEQQQNSGHSSHPSQSQSEHAKLMVDSLTMFESQLLKLAPVLGAAGANHVEMLTRNAQTLVVNAERLNTMLKSGNSRALDTQIEAEVEGDYGPGPRDSLVDVWRKIGGEYREGLRTSDDLVRALTGFLLGVRRVMKEYVQTQYGSQFGSEAGSVYGGTPRSSPVVHGRSISLGEEDIRMRGGGGGVSPDFGRESRRSWEPSVSGVERGGGSSNASASTGACSREEALRRLAGVRSDSPLARASPAFHAARELDRQETASPAAGAAGVGLPKVNIPRRLFAPSQQREMALVAESGQDSIDYEPSPTPASRTRGFDRGELTVPMVSTQQQFHPSPLRQAQEIPLDRSKAVSPLVQNHALETPLRRNLTISVGGNGDSGDKVISSRDRHERRKISIASIASIATIRGATSNSGTTTSGESAISSTGLSVPIGFSMLSSPSGATTAVTLDSGISGAMSISRTPSNNSGSSSLYSSSTRPTFSRPEGLSGLQQQLEGYRKRVEHESVLEGAGGSDANSGGGDAGGKERSGNGTSLITPESEREIRRKTYGSRVGGRVSLDAGGRNAGEFGERDRAAGERPVVDLTVNAADRSAAATIGGTGMKERRRTVTDIWPRS